VWRASLDLPAARLQSLEGILSADERVRAERFLFRRDRARFVAARGTLRILLGRYMSIDPGYIRFSYGPRGKPALATRSCAPITFNVSHSEERALYVVADGREVGIDVEHVRSFAGWQDVAGRFFSPREIGRLTSFPDQAIPALFFQYWTRKEAYLKAVGDGLVRPLHEVDVSWEAGEGTGFHIHEASLDGAQWCVIDLTPAPGYAAALAFSGSVPRLGFWECRV